MLEGDRLVTTPYDIKFRVDKDNELLCSRQLNEPDLAKFRKAVQKDYYFQASGGGEHQAALLPIWSPAVRDTRPYSAAVRARLYC